MAYYITSKQKGFITQLLKFHEKTTKETFDIYAPGKEKALYSLTSNVASKIVSNTEVAIKTRTGARRLSKRAIVGDALHHNNGAISKTYQELSTELLGNYPLSFQRNVKDGKREDLPMYEQKELLHQLCEEMFSKMTFGGKKEQQTPPKEEEKIPEPPKEKEDHEFLKFVREARAFCKQRAADGKPLDEIGLRPAEFGAKMLAAGISATAVKHAMTMHWPPEARRAMKVRDYDVTSFRKEARKVGFHSAYPYIRTLAIEAKIPICLCGPKGTGKTTLAMQLAEDLELPFAMVSMTSGTSPSAFNGRPKIGGDGGVVESQFVKIFRDGGVFLFDEMDAADENLLLLVNAALANGVFFNTATGEKVLQHPNFIPVAGMNTLGLGAGRDYGARNKLDAATLDRWNCGRVWVTLDEEIESRIFYSILGEERS